MAGIELVADKATGQSYPWQEKRGARACLAARKQGVLLRQLGDVVVILPPLCITPDQIDRLACAARAGIEEVTAGGQQACAQRSQTADLSQRRSSWLAAQAKVGGRRAVLRTPVSCDCLRHYPRIAREVTTADVHLDTQVSSPRKLPSSS